MTDKDAINSVRALADTLKKTQGKLTSRERSALVKAVLNTVAPAKPQPAPSNGKAGKK